MRVLSKLMTPSSRLPICVEILKVDGIVVRTFRVTSPVDWEAFRRACAVVEDDVLSLRPGQGFCNTKRVTSIIGEAWLGPWEELFHRVSLMSSVVGLRSRERIQKPQVVSI